MYFVCLYLLITALTPAVVGYSLYMRAYSKKNKKKHTTARFKSVPHYTAWQRVDSVKIFSKFSESTFDSLPASM